MSELETNIYRITNLRDLASSYRTYRVVNRPRNAPAAQASPSLAR